jgi:hypothetical protein
LGELTLGIIDLQIREDNTRKLLNAVDEVRIRHLLLALGLSMQICGGVAAHKHDLLLTFSEGLVTVCHATRCQHFIGAVVAAF